MHVLFCGSGSFAVPSLRAVCAAGHEVVRVVTQPARRAGRGRGARSAPIAQAAEDLDLPRMECANVNEPSVVEALAAERPDVLCVVDFGQLLRKPVRQVAARSAFNLHGSLLPALRGAAPVNWAILRGHRETGVTTFELVDRMDAGPIYLQARTPLQPNETAGELRARLAELGAGVVCETLERLASGRAQPKEQDHDRATLAPRLCKEDGRIDWTADAQAVRNRIHGTWPWPGARVRLVRADDAAGRAVTMTLARAAARPEEPAGEPGVVNDDLSVSCGRGRLEILELKPAGKRCMTWRDFVNGYRVAPGDRFVDVE